MRNFNNSNMMNDIIVAGIDMMVVDFGMHKNRRNLS